MQLINEYYNSGKLKGTGKIDNMQKQGKWVYYFESGNRFREISYIDDIENGEWKMWHENGQLYIEQYKVKGESEGLWREYYENGKVKEVGEYKNGVFCPIDFWDEHGNQILKNGTGKKIEKFGASDFDIFEQYFEDGVYIKEVKIASTEYKGFNI